MKENHLAWLYLTIALYALFCMLFNSTGGLKEEEGASGTWKYGGYYRAICLYAQNEP